MFANSQLKLSQKLVLTDIFLFGGIPAGILLGIGRSPWEGILFGVIGGVLFGTFLVLTLGAYYLHLNKKSTAVYRTRNQTWEVGLNRDEALDLSLMGLNSLRGNWKVAVIRKEGKIRMESGRAQMELAIAGNGDDQARIQLMTSPGWLGVFTLPVPFRKLRNELDRLVVDTHSAVESRPAQVLPFAA